MQPTYGLFWNPKKLSLSFSSPKNSIGPIFQGFWINFQRLSENEQNEEIENVHSLCPPITFIRLPYLVSQSLSLLACVKK